MLKVMSAVSEIRTEESTDSEGESVSKGTNEREPEDKHNLVFCACIMCGASFLMPWNSITMAVDFFQTTYPGKNIMFAISVSYLAVVGLGSALSSMTVELLNPNIKIISGFVITIVCMAYLTFIEAWIRPFPLDVSFHIVLVCCVLVSFGSALMQSNLYGLFSMLPMRYVRALMVGESFAGSFTVVIRIFTKAVIPDIKISTIIFFSTSLLVSVLCLVVFVLEMRSPYVKHHVYKCQIIDDGEETVLLQGDELGVETSKTGEYGSAVENDKNKDVAESSTRKKEPLLVQIKRAIENRLVVIRVIWPFMLAFWLNYFVTLGVFPSLSSEMINCQLGTWMPVIMLSLFNVFDLIGKIFTRWEYDWKGFHLVLCSTARVLLIPLFIMCATPRLHPIMSGLAPPLILTSINGLTNGYFGCVPILIAPSKVSAEKKEIAGNLMIVALTTGLAFGSGAAYGYLAILEPLTVMNNPCLQNGTGPV